MKLPAIKSEWLFWGVGAGVVLLVLNSVMNGRIVSQTAAAVGRLPSDLIYGGAEGLFGIPDTRKGETQSKCAAALASGDDWGASFNCPALPWGRGLFDGK